MRGEKEGSTVFIEDVTPELGICELRVLEK